MEEIEIINEKPLTLVEVKTVLSEIEKRKNEETPKKLKEYLNVFAKTDAKKSAELIKKLKELELLRLKDKQIVSIVNLLPKDMDNLKAVFAGEDTTLKQEDMIKIMETVKQYG